MKLFVVILAIIYVPLAQADSFKLKWIINSELEYFQEASKSFKANVEKKTQGRLTVEIVSIKADQANHDHLQDILDGKADMGQELVYKLKKYAPGLEVWDVPFLFKTDEHIERYISSDLAKQDLADLAKTSITPLGYSFSGGFIYYYGPEFVESVSNLKGSKLGMEPSSSKYNKFLKANFQINPILIERGEQEYAEIIAGVGDELLKQGRVNSLKITESSHRVISRIIFISDVFLASLPEDIREIVIEEGEAVSRAERIITVSRKESFLKQARQQNVPIKKTNNDSSVMLKYIKSFDKSLQKRVKQIQEL